MMGCIRRFPRLDASRASPSGPVIESLNLVRVSISEQRLALFAYSDTRILPLTCGEILVISHSPDTPGTVSPVTPWKVGSP
jgi:hypothetical protein